MTNRVPIRHPLCLWAAFLAGAQFALAVLAPAAAALTPRDSAAIVLQRLAYGPRPGEVERVAASGVARWIEAQLAPGKDPACAKVEADFEILKLDRAELAQRYLEARRERRQRRAQARDSTEIEPGDAMREMNDLRGQFQQLAVARAVTAERQLQEVLADFWINHFNIFLGKNAERFLMPSFVEETIRPRLLGRFEDLLIATAESPAMMVYLDNTLSVAAGATPPRLERARARGRRSVRQLVDQLEARMPKGVNENYARELFELHTLGVDGGYSQRDVEEAARVLTGWGAEPAGRGGDFVFRAWAHDRGEKTVLGTRFPAGGGREEGVRLLRMLARHPSTMHHVTTKLCVRLVGDDPPAGVVEAGVEAWRRSDGSIREVVRAIVMNAQFWQEASARARFKTPLEFVISSVRALDGSVGAEPGIARTLARLGQPLYLQPAPTGYEETAEAWANSAALFERMNVAVALAAGKVPGVAVDLDPVIPVTANHDDLLTRLNHVLLSGFMSERTRSVILREIGDLSPERARTMAVGLVLGGPEFQVQ